MSNRKRLFVSFLAAVFFPLIAFAQVNYTLDEKPSQPDGVANCFDYYKFQSVQVGLGSEKNEYSAGDEIKFTGNIVNNNSYPVVDGLVFARIGRKNPNYVSEGQFTIDEIIPLENIDLDANESKHEEFSWKVPENIMAGDYRIDFFFSVGKKFNLGGLPFTNEVVVGFDDFTVKSNNKSEITLDRSDTKLNGQKYNHVGNSPVVDQGSAVTVLESIKNTYSQDQNVKITYDLYFWDSLNKKDIIETKQESVTIPANGKKDLTYISPEIKDTVYYLKITAEGEQRSIANIRFFSNAEHARLNYPAITKFPLQKGDGYTLFSCFHNTSYPNTEGSVELTLTDKNNKKVASAEYNGQITGAMAAAKSDLKADNDYTWLKLTAELKNKEGKVIDSYETVYDCNTLGGDACKNLLALKAQSGSDANSINNLAGIGSKKNILLTIVAIIVMLPLLVVTSWWLGKKNRWFVFLLLFALGAGAFSVPSVRANFDSSATGSGSYSVSHNLGGCCGYTISGSASLTTTVGLSSSSTTVSPGNNIDFYASTDANSLTYNSTGYNLDSPYGYFPDSGFPGYDGSSRWSGFALGTSKFPDRYAYYYTVAASQPSVSMSSDNSSVVSCSGMTCTAVAAGTATVTANISGATGYVYTSTSEGPFTDNFGISGGNLSWLITVESPKVCDPGAWDPISCRWCSPDGKTWAGPPCSNWGPPANQIGWCGCARHCRPLEYNAKCGPAIHGSYSSAPTSGLCDLGSPSSVTGDASNWSWTCGTACNIVPCGAAVCHPSYNDVSCSSPVADNPSVNCNSENDCGKSVKYTSYCKVNNDGCGGSGYSVDMSYCTAKGLTCKNERTVCPACAGWKEVKPN